MSDPLGTTQQFLTSETIRLSSIECLLRSSAHNFKNIYMYTAALGGGQQVTCSNRRQSQVHDCMAWRQVPPMLLQDVT